MKCYMVAILCSVRLNDLYVGHAENITISQPIGKNMGEHTYMNKNVNFMNIINLCKSNRAVSSMFSHFMC